MKKKLVMLLAVFGLLGIIVGCGNTEKVTGKKVEKQRSEDVFANGDSFKMRDSDNLSYYFEITSTEPNVLTVCDLENNRREYRFGYTAVKQENGHLLYTFDGERINGDSVFSDYIGIKPEYYIVEIESNYFFVHASLKNEEIMNSGKSVEEIKDNHPAMFEYKIMDKF